MKVNYSDYCSETWIYLTADERLLLLQKTEIAFAKEQRRPAKRVEMYDFESGGSSITIGAWNKSTNKIYVNREILENGMAGIYGNATGYKMLENIAHEGYHAYQSECIKNPELIEDKQKLRNWMLNDEQHDGIRNYISPKENRSLYEIQPKEYDAFHYGRQKALEIGREIGKKDESFSVYENAARLKEAQQQKRMREHGEELAKEKQKWEENSQIIKDFDKKYPQEDHKPIVNQILEINEKPNVEKIKKTDYLDESQAPKEKFRDSLKVTVEPVEKRQLSGNPDTAAGDNNEEEDMPEDPVLEREIPESFRDNSKKVIAENVSNEQKQGKVSEETFQNQPFSEKNKEKITEDSLERSKEIELNSEQISDIKESGSLETENRENSEKQKERVDTASDKIEEKNIKKTEEQSDFTLQQNRVNDKLEGVVQKDAYNSAFENITYGQDDAKLSENEALMENLHPEMDYEQSAKWKVEDIKKTDDIQNEDMKKLSEQPDVQNILEEPSRKETMESLDKIGQRRQQVPEAPIETESMENLMKNSKNLEQTINNDHPLESMDELSSNHSEPNVEESSESMSSMINNEEKSVPESDENSIKMDENKGYEY